MSKSRGVSGKTHSEQQLNNNVNQYYSNNATYRAKNNSHSNQLNPNNQNYQGKNI